MSKKLKLTRPMTPKRNNSAIVNAAEACVILGIHLNTLKRTPPDELSFFRIGRRGDRRYKRDDLLDYMARRTERMGRD
jgi:hypothetical protein